MKFFVWLSVACIGVAIMVAAFRADGPIDLNTPFSSGLVYAPRTTDGTTPAESAVDLPTTNVRMRLLPPGPIAEAILKELKEQDKERVHRMAFQLCEKLFELSPADAGITEDALSSGRLPQPGKNEVLGGSETEEGDRIEIAGTTLSVVGRLKRDVALFARSYVIPVDTSTQELFDPADNAVRTAVIVSVTPEQLRDDEVREELAKRFPTEQFDATSGSLRTQKGPFFGYLLGQALLCLGGSGFFIGLYAAAAPRVRWSVLREPLADLAKYRTLLWGVHLVFFGLYFVAAIVAYAVPDIQNFLVLSVQRELGSGEGPLGFAGKAYASGSIPLAALATFVINMFIGSALVLTLPSCVLPASGTIVAAFRACLWGLILGPSLHLFAEKMLLHSGTLLLEGEGYILATFFGLLVPVYLVRADLGPSLLARYGRAVMLNLKGNLLVALVLLVAAIYEAVEVISMMK